MVVLSHGLMPKELQLPLKLLYTAADHCQLNVHGVSVLQLPFQVTFWMPPGSPPEGTWKGRPQMNSLPDNPEHGASVSQQLLFESKVVVAVVQLGEKVISPVEQGKL